MHSVYDPAKAAAETKKIRDRQLRMLLLVLLMVVAALLLNDIVVIADPWLTMDDVAIVAALLLLAIVAGTVAHWRCPACRKSLWRWYYPFYCPSCGIRLQG